MKIKKTIAAILLALASTTAIADVQAGCESVCNTHLDATKALIEYVYTSTDANAEG